MLLAVGRGGGKKTKKDKADELHIMRNGLSSVNGNGQPALL